jgi:hypothetical protein
LREVHARLGITPAILYGKFPEIHRAIAARRHAFWRYSRNRNLQVPYDEAHRAAETAHKMAARCRRVAGRFSSIEPVTRFIVPG